MQLNPLHKSYLRKVVRAFYTSVSITHIRNRLAKNRSGVLVYAGVHNADTFARIFTLYETCYGFEADPELFAKLKRLYQNIPQVHIINCAVADYDGEIEFNICSAKGCSSIGKFSERWEADLKFKMVKTITLPCINLFNFLQSENIHEITDYFSDIQGFDLQALKTMKPYIDNGKIKSIQSEVSTDKELYKDMPDNSEGGFNELLGEKYELVARISSLQSDAGNGILRAGMFGEIPEHYWDMDYKWTVKSQ